MAYLTTAQVVRSSKDGKFFDAITVPQGIPVSNVRVPESRDPVMLDPRTHVLIWILDSFGAIFVSKLIDPVGTTDLSRALILQDDGTPFLEPGEKEILSKSGASIYLQNTGDIHLLSGHHTEKLNISSSDQSVSAEASYVELRGNTGTLGVPLRPVIGVTSLGTARLGIEPTTNVLPLKVVLHEIGLKIDGDIVLRNAASNLHMSALGTIDVLGLSLSITAPTTSLTTNLSTTGLFTSTAGASIVSNTPAGVTINTLSLTLPATPLAIKVGVVPGFTGTVANPTSITVVNGIVVAVT